METGGDEPSAAGTPHDAGRGSGAAPRVVASIVSYNGLRVTRRCLESLRGVAYPNLDVVVVDNASADGSADAIAAEFPEVHLIRSARNRGYTFGCNQGILWAEGHGADYVLLLSNDVVVEPGLVDRLIECARSSEPQAIVSPLVLPLGAPDDHFARHWPKQSDPPLPAEPQEWVPGSCILAPMEAVRRVGLWDEGFFMFMTDVEWSRRAAGLGVPLLACRAARIRHEMHHGGNQVPVRRRFLTTRNRLWVHRRHRRRFRRVRAVAMSLVRSAARIARCAVRREWELLEAEARGAFQGVFVPVPPSPPPLPGPRSQVPRAAEAAQGAASRAGIHRSP